MISINNFVMLDHLIVEQEFLDRLLGKKIVFDVQEGQLGTTEFEKGTAQFKVLPLNTTKSTSLETTLEHVSYDHVLQIFTINKQHKTRSFAINE